MLYNVKNNLLKEKILKVDQRREGSTVVEDRVRQYNDWQRCTYGIQQMIKYSICFNVVEGRVRLDWQIMKSSIEYCFDKEKNSMHQCLENRIKT